MGRRKGEDVDVDVIGFQEFVDLNAQSLLREATDMPVARRRECQARRKRPRTPLPASPAGGGPAETRSVPLSSLPRPRTPP